MNLMFITVKQSETSNIKAFINIHDQELLRQAELERFLNNFGLSESGNNPDMINRIGCFGTFQFRESTLKTLGYNITLRDFKKNRSCYSVPIQKETMLKLIHENEKSLSEVIKTWNGIYKIYKKDEILITKSGIIASAHLAGVNAVIQFLYYDNDKFVDYNGTKISNYMKKFAGYKF